MTIAIIAFLAIAGAGVAIILGTTGNKKKKDALRQKRYIKMYRFLSTFFITQPFVNNLYKKISNLSIYRKPEIQAMTSKLFLVSWGISAGVILISVFMFGDILTILLCVTFAVVLTTVVVDKQIDSLQLKVLKAFVNALTSIRQEYLVSGSIVEALENAEVSPLIKRPMEEITAALTAVNGEVLLQEFRASTPFRTIQTFASICYKINNEGDEKDIYGQSNFANALTLMLSDTNSEIEKTIFRKKTFGFVEYFPIMPILGIAPIQFFFQTQIPGTALVYNSPYGYMIRVLIVFMSIIAYTIISRINSTMAIKPDDRSPFLNSLLDKRFFNHFAQNLAPKNKSRRKLEGKFKQALSRLTPEEYYLKKAMYAGAALVLSLIVAVSTVNLGKEYIKNSTQQMSLIASDEMKNFTKEQILALDDTYLANPNKYYNDDEITALVKARMTGLSDMQIGDQVKRLKSKKDSLENAYFKWWYVWICVGVGLMGWFSPDAMMMLRKTLVRTEEEDDFLQLQTLVTILTNTNIDTLDLLGELSENSTIHKDMFLYAYQGYASNPELEISRLQSKTTLVDFKRFIGSLKLSISQLSLKEAYSDLTVEREHILRIRDMTIKETIQNKRAICSPIAYIPLGLLILGMFLLPLGILGWTEMMGAMSSIS